MRLCLDVGNTHVLVGVFQKNSLISTFTYPSKGGFDQHAFGRFIQQALCEQGLGHETIAAACFCSVVPHLNDLVFDACQQYCSVTPLEINHQTNTGIALEIDDPNEVGMDRIVNGVAAAALCPNRNIIIADFGTATTVCAFSNKHAFLGGAILPGMRLSMNALSTNTAQLSTVDIVKPKAALGKNTQTNIQSGLYYSQLGAVSMLVDELNQTVFADSPAVVVATGGDAALFAETELLSRYQPDLILHGLKLLLDRLC